MNTFTKLFPLLLLCLTLTGYSYSSDDEEVELTGIEKEENDRYKALVTSDLEKVLKNTFKMTIHRGTTPPDIQGFYKMEMNCTKSTIPYDPDLNTLMSDFRMKLFNQLGFDIDMDGNEVQPGTYKYEADQTSTGNFISGSGDSFSVIFNDYYQTDTSEAISLSIFSGTLDRDKTGKVVGIKNMQHAIVMKGNKGNYELIGNGEGRFFEDDYAEVITEAEYNKIEKGISKSNSKKILLSNEK